MTTRWTRFSGGLIALVGCVLATILLVDAATSHEPVYWVVESYPVVLSLILLGAGVLLARGRLIADRFLGRLIAWMGIGVVSLSLLNGYLLSLLVIFAGHRLLDMPVGTITIHIFGALVGLLLGIYDVRALERKHAIKQLGQVNNTLRIATGELVDKTDRDALERTVCERLAESDAYQGAWISQYGTGDDCVSPVAWAGLDDAFIESTVGPALDGRDSTSVYNRALRTQEVQFDPNVFADTNTEQSGTTFAQQGIVSMALVPIVGSNCVYGLLGIYATQESSFDVEHRDVFDELGETVGQAIDSIRAHEGLERRERELVAHNERLDNFASVVSHDLRNPLNVILGRAELIQEREAAEHVGAISRAGNRMEEIIADLLVLSRAGRSVADSASVSLAAVARDSWENVATDGNEFDLRVPNSTRVTADRARLMNVFENLFRNAVEHNDSPVTVRVGTLETVPTANTGDSVGFFVEDDGVGIPADARDSVFDHGYTTNTNGTGFGLSIVKEIVGAHGWAVSVGESAEGGARFEIRPTGPFTRS